MCHSIRNDMCVLGFGCMACVDIQGVLLVCVTHSCVVLTIDLGLRCLSGVMYCSFVWLLAVGV